VASRWANDFVGLANTLLRERAIQESTRNIEFLNKQLAQTTVVEIQHVMNQLLENETKNLMLAHGRLDYAFTVVDPAVPPEQRFSPRRTLMVISGLFIGGFFGSLIAWARKALRRHPPAATH
jgi:LPS O-antigen subunit length determinant protein (WzzB/FepE family)